MHPLCQSGVSGLPSRFFASHCGVGVNEWPFDVGDDVFNDCRPASYSPEGLAGHEPLHGRDLLACESDEFAKGRRLVGWLSVDDARFGVSKESVGDGPGVFVDGTEVAEVLEDGDVGGAVIATHLEGVLGPLCGGSVGEQPPELVHDHDLWPEPIGAPESGDPTDDSDHQDAEGVVVVTGEVDTDVGSRGVDGDGGVSEHHPAGVGRAEGV